MLPWYLFLTDDAEYGIKEKVLNYYKKYLCEI